MVKPVISPFLKKIKIAGNVGKCMHDCKITAKIIKFIIVGIFIQLFMHLPKHWIINLLFEL